MVKLREMMETLIEINDEDWKIALRLEKDEGCAEDICDTWREALGWRPFGNYIVSEWYLDTNETPLEIGIIIRQPRADRGLLEDAGFEI